MLDERKLTTYVRGVAGALRTLGPTPRARVLDMLRAFESTETEVIAVDLRAGPAAPRALPE